MSTKPRNAQLAKIHIAVKDLGLDDAAYREMLWTVARVRSAKNLDPHGRQQVLEHLKARGWSPARPKRKGQRPRNADVESRRELMAKIEAYLTDAGRPWSYAEALARRIAKRDALTFCAERDLWKVMVALEHEARKRLKAELTQECIDRGYVKADEFAAHNALDLATSLGKREFFYGSPEKPWPTVRAETNAELMSKVLRWLRGEIESEREQQRRENAAHA